MNPIIKCNVASEQHYWVTLPNGKGLQLYSCPMCSQVVYWSDTILEWVKPTTSGNRRIKGNNLPTEGSTPASGTLEAQSKFPNDER